MYFTLISFVFTILVSVLYNKSLVDTNIKTVFNKQTIVNVMMSFGSEEESLIRDLKQHKYNLLILQIVKPKALFLEKRLLFHNRPVDFAKSLS